MNCGKCEFYVNTLTYHGCKAVRDFYAGDERSDLSNQQIADMIAELTGYFAKRE